MSYKYIDAEVLIGKTIQSISKIESGDGVIKISTSDGKRYDFLHNQDCCESVSVHDVRGDPQLLVGNPLILASKEEDRSWPDDVPVPDYTDSSTWTTITLETKDTKVVIRWLGESNGYYGEGVDLEEIE